MPKIWAFEVANSIFVSFAKRRRITEHQVEEYLKRLKALPISMETCDLWSIVDLEAAARRWNLTSYDAAYLDLAKRKAVPPATTDQGLKRVALAEGIEILSQ